ncbi:MFS transporter [Rugosimonospora acidiphila]|uniref:MFS transporter n=1 Tax=Rugosimonospora acidiphila TaxID=556531 RepID=A0ABP9RHL0_9ACTN
MAICCLSLFIVSLDNTIVNVALPSIQRDLGASVSGLQWTIDAYTLVLASLLMLSGSTADRVGRRRVFQIGLVIFGVGSLLCSVAPNIGTLVGFRILQAIGGSMLNPVAMSIITNVFTDRRQRATAIGVWGGVVGISFALGPTVGGLLVQSVGWRSIFWINIPVVVAAIVLTAMFVPESRAARSRRIDPFGQVLVLLTLATLTYGIIEGPGRGWASPEILGCFVVAVGSVIGLLLYEPRRQEPLLDLRFFRSAPFSGATLIAISGFGAMGAFLFLNTLYLQDSRGFSALDAGLLTLPLAVVMSLCAPWAGRMVSRRGGRLPLAVGGIAMAAGAAVMTSLTEHTSIALLFVSYVIFGIGFGLLNPPITNTAVSGMPVSQAGVAAAVASTSRQVGQSLGIAVVGSVVTSAVHGSLQVGFASASHAGWWIITCCGLVVAVLGFVTTGRWARRTAATVAAEFIDEPSRVPAGVR